MRLIRAFDVVLSAVGLVVASPLLLLLLLAGWLDTRSPIFTQVRVGRFQRPFLLIKFRTMKPETPSVATHLADVKAITPLGRVLRASKLDELPQLLNVLRGDMSLVGPRPCLFNQTELIQERAALGVYDAKPGVTGLAQVNRVDMSTPKRLAETDARMLAALSVADYFRYILLTIAGKRSAKASENTKFTEPSQETNTI